MTGIILQWYLQLQPATLWSLFAAGAAVFASLFFIPFFERFRLGFLNGIAVAAIFVGIGGMLAWHKNIQHDANWFGNKYLAGDHLIVTLLEDPVEKTKSYKANAAVDFIIRHDTAMPFKGTIIIYFKKDSLFSSLQYGNRLIITKPLQQIKNSGNPGGFDYKRYSLFQGITHQVYLKENEYRLLNSERKQWFTRFINTSRQKILGILRSNIKGDKELGLAEALLIGYKDDLDKTLVQSYSNTGVVHVIAISGLHLGLIYWLLVQLLKPLSRKKHTRWLKPVLIVTGLWLFSLLAGAQPSVVRSAVMFTCIVIGESLTRKPSIYNTLAFSAFLLLCYNPFWLWDVGFQLSYAAVLSIVIFMQPVYNWLYVKNKLLDFIWKLNAVTIAAQVLTVPVGIYHFHQFPASFLLTNFLAVPLSSIILLGEILLCVISFIPAVAVFIGKILSLLIWLMNRFVERIEKLPFSLWDGLQITIPQAVLLLVVAAGIGYWLMEKRKTGLQYVVLALFAFVALRAVSFIKAQNRQQLIIYNVPQKQAMDLINGRTYFFIGDKDLLADDFVRNFHIKPSRILHRTEGAGSTGFSLSENNLLSLGNKKIMILNETSRFTPATEPIALDLLIISGNPKLYFDQLIKTFSVKQVVFDGACPAWKIKYWKKDCDSLHIPVHDVSEEGAFIMNIRRGQTH
jgi:competence protein ComEC